MDCSPPGSSIHPFFQARILEWVAISFSRGSSWPRDRTPVSRVAGRRFTIWTTREAPFRCIDMSCCLFIYHFTFGLLLFSGLGWYIFVYVMYIPVMIPWTKAWQPAPVFLPGKSHGQRSLTGYTKSIGSQRVRHYWSDLACIHIPV